jgi:hypothetical protein
MDWTIAAQNEFLQFGATAVALHADPIPAIVYFWNGIVEGSVHKCLVKTVAKTVCLQTLSSSPVFRQSLRQRFWREMALICDD